MVTASRMTQSVPTVSLPLKSLRRIWPSPPITACGWTTVRAPTVVSPVTATWLSRRTPSPSVTVRSTMQKGPISTPAPSCAPSSTIAVGWIAMSGVGADHRAELAFGMQRLADIGLTLELPHRPAVLDRLDVEADHVAGDDGFAE